jgi:hypothetical protein
MPYIGKSPVGGGFHKLDNLTASATATYALTLGGAAYYPETANQLLVSLNGVIQAPQDSFTISGSNLIFDSALTASDSIDFVVALGDVLGVQGVTDGTVTTAKIANGAVTDAKIANSAVTSAKLDSNIDIAGTLDVTGALTADSGIKLGSGTDALSNYDEGTFTATVAAESGTINSYSVIAAKYTRIGDIVHVFVRFQVTDKGTGTNFVVSGLPFASSRELLGLFSETNTTGLTGFMFTAGTGATSFTSRRADGWGNNCLVNGSYSVSVTYHI